VPGEKEGPKVPAELDPAPDVVKMTPADGEAM
jgi:hypothetical protein